MLISTTNAGTSFVLVTLAAASMQMCKYLTHEQDVTGISIARSVGMCLNCDDSEPQDDSWWPMSSSDNSILDSNWSLVLTLYIYTYLIIPNDKNTTRAVGNNTYFSSFKPVDMLLFSLPGRLVRLWNLFFWLLFQWNMCRILREPPTRQRNSFSPIH